MSEPTVEELGAAINDCTHPLHKEAVWRMAVCVEGVVQFSASLGPVISLNHLEPTLENLYAKALKYVDTAIPYEVLQIDHLAEQSRQ